MIHNYTLCVLCFMYLHVVSSGLGIPSRQYVKPPSPITFIPPRISSAPSTCTSLVGYVSDDEGMEMENYSDSHDNNANVHVSWFLLHTYIAYIFIGFILGNRESGLVLMSLFFVSCQSTCTCSTYCTCTHCV